MLLSIFARKSNRLGLSSFRCATNMFYWWWTHSLLFLVSLLSGLASHCGPEKSLFTATKTASTERPLRLSVSLAVRVYMVWLHYRFSAGISLVRNCFVIIQRLERKRRYRNELSCRAQLTSRSHVQILRGILLKIESFQGCSSSPVV